MHPRARAHTHTHKYVYTHREELNRKMDHKRQEMSSSQQMLRQLEDRVQGLREERLKLRDRLQKREGLVTKKGELTTEIDTCEREVKVQAPNMCMQYLTLYVDLGNCACSRPHSCQDHHKIVYQ